ncbi:MAG: hypothetical protein COU40_00725 [Candidatus Moranbacteria bacterium CG10_big_fil_rev_8_21_14_0_10_35_21]|nr:MAG: hypothetical protein COU40_00725 [Candidatus Moranbacteria bacterium CG10_big_fil_rev_8_21_14_0_10_35_21]PJA88956.1 MAG: hypothetical protein CO139_00380 [Candidatus Moranbacteria bacterium CG_4_9_14_3_um_filter_36_9]
MAEVLETLFGSKEKTRILRFFLQNPEQEYAIEEVSKRNMLKRDKTKKELDVLVSIKFILLRTKKGRKSYVLNQNFIFYPELKNFISKANIYPQSKSLDRIKNLGNVKLAVISGAFINYPKSKADMILVADGISRAKLKNVMSSLEAEIGKEIDFVLMTGDEFKYRLNMLDKFILEFLEGPHEEIINKISGLKRFIANRK